MMTDFKALSKTQRRIAVEAGLIKRVTDLTGMDKSTISRTFHGHIKVPNPSVAAAINDELARIASSKGRAA